MVDMFNGFRILLLSEHLYIFYEQKVGCDSGFNSIFLYGNHSNIYSEKDSNWDILLSYKLLGQALINQ